MRNIRGDRRGLHAVVAAIAAFTFLTLSSAAQTPAPPLDASHAEAFADGAVSVAMQKDHIAGVSIAIIRGHDVLLAKGYGMAAPGKPADADTLFRVGSISKTGTWIALMQLVQKGKISLDDPINAHLPPELQIPDEDFKAPIRIRDLMDHNAGFEDSVFGHLFMFDPNKLRSQDATLAHFRVLRVRPPGQIAVYSNYGAGLAGSIVAHESGMDWPTYAERNILRPLGMTSATYRDPLPASIAQERHLAAPMPPDVAARVTQGWKYDGGRLVKTPYELVSQIASAGALSMSANDAARYMIALLNPETMEQSGVLKADTLVKMQQPLFSNVPEFGQLRHGFMTYELGGGRWGFGHDGGLISHISRLVVSPQLNVGVFVSINTQGEAGQFPGNFELAFFKHFFPPAKQAEAKVSHADAVRMAQRYAGTYRALRRAYFRTEAGIMSLLTISVTAAPDGDLIAGGLLTPATRLHPVGNGIYAQEDHYERTAFAERGGRMLMFDGFGVGPAERISYFESLNWFNWAVLLGLFAAIWGVCSGIRRIALGLETPAAYILDGLCLLWLLAIAAFLAGLLPLVMDNTLIFSNYPGVMLPLGCWLMLAAAIATPVAVIVMLALTRPRDWSWFRWLRVALAIAVFVVLALTFWQHGLLGFSDWA